MKITFEGHFVDLVAEIESFLATVKRKGVVENTPNKNYESKPVAPAAQGPGPDVFAAGDKPVDKPVDKPAKPVNPQIAKMQAAKAAKKAEREAAAAQPAPAPAPAPKAAAPLDPAELVKLRTKTIEELQAAYANGHQKEVFELLSRFGNGAKSFRELPPEAFAPIREAIDLGALT
jgi:predicted lipid-binding transport protein (Tim44 family)